MIDMNSINNARAAGTAIEKEEREQRLNDQARTASIKSLEELIKQNDLLTQQNKQAEIELVETRKNNKKVLFWAVFSAIVGLLSLLVAIVAIIISLVK